MVDAKETWAEYFLSDTVSFEDLPMINYRSF
jgi:hypothetical protein